MVTCVLLLCVILLANYISFSPTHEIMAQDMPWDVMQDTFDSKKVAHVRMQDNGGNRSHYTYIISRNSPTFETVTT